MVGPKFQDDLTSLLICFREHVVNLVEDITKMYRQEPIQDDKLLTVTYGESCAPYLAIRSIACSSKECLNYNIITLGLEWHPVSDTYAVSVSPIPQYDKVTKHILLSEIAKVFDPLGWLSPVTIQSKLLLQSLWERQLDWDNPLPIDIWENW
ncbi:hypothetical protein PR048_020871 [Dryococelus australis]|uniref:Uncharacterized protein n=1 Tax=Dryococelus australis TaxID=614101 RepID=A0ABQ9GWQ2_9NEOP|nr:hypothetical protein PR048_020871 [Dryococelus australis]